ncbi:hypothetical protein ACSVC9_14810 [Clostridium sp. LBM24168]
MKDLINLYSTYLRIRQNQATPYQMLKIVLYSYMNHNYSSRTMGFRRFLSKGKNNVLSESILLAMAHNINKLLHLAACYNL